MSSRCLSTLVRGSGCVLRPEFPRAAISRYVPPSPFYLRNAANRSFSTARWRFEQSSTVADAAQDASTHKQSVASSDVDLLKTLPPDKPEQPSYALVFTCKECKHRSAHRISKHGYSQGTVLVQCPSCKNRHLISDHLKIFSDSGVTLEQILAEKGNLLQKGGIGVDGDVELWNDGTQT